MISTFSGSFELTFCRRTAGRGEVAALPRWNPLSKSGVWCRISVGHFEDEPNITGGSPRIFLALNFPRGTTRNALTVAARNRVLHRGFVQGSSSSETLELFFRTSPSIFNHSRGEGNVSRCRMQKASCEPCDSERPAGINVFLAPRGRVPFHCIRL